MKNLTEILGLDLIERLKQENAAAQIDSTNDGERRKLHPDVRLFTNWAYRVPKGWYGFALGYDVPMSWADAIDKVLQYLAQETPEFEIHQIKLKFGGLRFYVDLKLHKCEKYSHLCKVIDDLEDLCFSKGLVY